MNTINKKHAIILPGNLSTYFLCLENYQNLCENNNIDIYILYSKRINYLHTELNGINKHIEIDNDDINLIKRKLGKNIKYFCAIEDIGYEYFIHKYIKIFQTNIEWIKNYNKQLDGWNYDDFINYERTRKYIDQFVRTYFLYDQIKKSGIEYEYIIRMRIDQYYGNLCLKNILDILNKNIYDFIWNHMDNFYIINKNYYDFFPYLLNNLGSMKTTSLDTYMLGPEKQFQLIVEQFIPRSKILALSFNVSISIFDNQTHYTYIYINGNTIPFGKYCENNLININNYKKKLSNNKNIIIKKNENIYFEKYKDTIFWVYTILLK